MSDNEEQDFSGEKHTPSPLGKVQHFPADERPNEFHQHASAAKRFIANIDNAIRQSSVVSMLNAYEPTGDGSYSARVTLNDGSAFELVLTKV